MSWPLIWDQSLSGIKTMSWSHSSGTNRCPAPAPMLATDGIVRNLFRSSLENTIKNASVPYIGAVETNNIFINYTMQADVVEMLKICHSFFTDLCWKGRQSILWDADKHVSPSAICWRGNFEYQTVLQCSELFLFFNLAFRHFPSSCFPIDQSAHSENITRATKRSNIQWTLKVVGLYNESNRTSSEKILIQLNTEGNILF